MVTCAVWLKAMPRPVLERPWCCLESPSVGLKYSIQLPAVFLYNNHCHYQQSEKVKVVVRQQADTVGQTYGTLLVNLHLVQGVQIFHTINLRSTDSTVGTLTIPATLTTWTKLKTWTTWTNQTTLKTPTDQMIYQDKCRIRILYLVMLLFDLL